MKEYCVDLRLAKELKENGFPQTSIFKWSKTIQHGTFVSNNEIDLLCFPPICSAPTSDEILKELPNRINDFFELYIDKCGEESYAIEYTDFDEINGHNTKMVFHELKLSNALAKMWLYLKKEGYIK